MPAWGRAAAYFLTLAAGVGIGIGTTEGRTGVPASAVGMLAALALVPLLALLGWAGDAVGAGKSSSWKENLLRAAAGAAACLGLGAVAAQDFLRPGITHGHDLGYHLWALWSTFRCVLDGDLWPRWNPYLGLGIPLLQFYSPLAYASAWPIQALGASPAQAFAAQMLAAQSLSACSAYASLRWLGGSRPAGILAAAALCLAPYHLLDQSFRTALGETLAFPLLPLVGAAAWRTARHGERRAAGVLAASLALLLLTHLLSIVTMGVAVLPLLVWARWRAGAAPRRAALRAAAAALLLSMGVTAAWWLPMLAEMGQTAVHRLAASGDEYSQVGVALPEPVQRRAWERYGVRKPMKDGPDPGRAMPMYFGAVLLALTALGLLRPKESADGDGASGPPDARPWALASLFSVALALAPVARLMDPLPLLTRTQFPWRFLGPATAFAALAAGLSLDAWLRAGLERRARAARGAALLGALAALSWDALPYLGAPARYPSWEGMGLPAFRSGKALSVDVPRDRFVRVEDATLPPDDYDWKLAKTRRVFPEYMSVSLRDRYGKRTKPPSRELSESLAVDFRVSASSERPSALDPMPWVSFRPQAGRYDGLPAASWERRPEWIRVALPEGLPAGRLRIAEGWFLGWYARAGGSGDWVAAKQSEWLLAADVPAGARVLEFRYSAWRPWDRGLGLLVSGALLLGLLLTALRSRLARRPS
jgi:hypothetical protein